MIAQNTYNFANKIINSSMTEQSAFLNMYLYFLWLIEITTHLFFLNLNLNVTYIFSLIPSSDIDNSIELTFIDFLSFI